MSLALVTGGSGFIGSHVVRKLLSEHLDVRALVRPQSNRANLSGLAATLVEGDLQNPASLRTALEGCDYLFHVAADYRLWSRHPEEMAKINVEGTRHLLQAAADAKIKKIVVTSSVAAVGRPTAIDGKPGIGREDLDPTREQLISPYKKTKWESDRLARDFAAQGLPVVIVNPAAPIGSYDIKPTPTGKIIVDFLNRKMPAYLDTGMNFVDVEDVAAGHWLAAQHGRIGERYILGQANMTLKAFLDLLGKISGLPSPRIKLPYAVAWIAGAVSTGLSSITGKDPMVPLDGVRMAHHPMYYDASKAVRELNIPQTPIEEAIKKAVDWFKSHAYVR